MECNKRIIQIVINYSLWTKSLGLERPLEPNADKVHQPEIYRKDNKYKFESNVTESNMKSILTKSPKIRKTDLTNLVYYIQKHGN